MHPSVARVVIDVRTRALDEPFDYAIPVDLADRIAIGCPVLVPLGTRRAVGFVVGVASDSRFDNLRPIEAILGESLSRADAYDLARWIADEYAAPLAEAMRLFLPPGGTPKVVKREVDGAVTWDLVRPTVSAAEDRVVTLLDSSYQPKAGARLQRSILDALRMGPVTSGELAAELGAVSAALKTLEQRGAVEVTARRRWRGESGRAREDTAHTLTTAQRDAVEKICASPGDVIVLEGVTGSGKTEVYLRAIEHTLAAGRDAIVLVPEISLTPQTVGRFRARFGNLVAVLHSRLSVGERFDQWSLAAQGDAKVVVGARSALFAPVRDLGLVIIDEEHESSYKQSSAPRYHARDVAAHIAESSSVTVVLGSATPSMEARAAVDDCRWVSAMLPERVTAHGLPEVRIVDMGAEFGGGNRSMFSSALGDAIDAVRQRKSKGVLFLNRRGFASFLLCRECGYVPRCGNCSVSLTYHERGDRLTCHHCGHTEPTPVTCPRCESPYLRRFGAGTQRVEDEIRARWPDLAVVRMDADTTSGKGGHERALAAFEDLESGLLLGTQMVAKGLDYPEVTLVGVINADTTMHLPDFRAAERTYQLLEQVSGRAGRGEDPGLVVVQTYWPDHPAIRAVAARDAEILYAEERELRASVGWAPYRRVANIVISGETSSTVTSYSSTLGAALTENLPEGWEVLGPSDAALARVKRAYRRHLIIKAEPGAALGPFVREVLSRCPAPAGIAVAPDIDPVDFL
ncbi:MAG: primosomal protein N' [Actinobacteria bacterium HGW-Actinobacteria-1]|nr:MAG: primosomal protein N' [Actinobacteria bacterium HGW-Actinobacteria-1]